jgi:hypothetical protein
VYAPDGEFEFGTGPNAIKGAAALKKMVAGFKIEQAARNEKGETR